MILKSWHSLSLIQWNNYMKYMYNYVFPAICTCIYIRGFGNQNVLTEYMLLLRSFGLFCYRKNTQTMGRVWLGREKSLETHNIRDTMVEVLFWKLSCCDCPYEVPRLYSVDSNGIDCCTLRWIEFKQ